MWRYLHRRVGGAALEIWKGCLVLGRRWNTTERHHPDISWLGDIRNLPYASPHPLHLQFFNSPWPVCTVYTPGPMLQYITKQPSSNYHNCQIIKPWAGSLRFSNLTPPAPSRSTCPPRGWNKILVAVFSAHRRQSFNNMTYQNVSKMRPLAVLFCKLQTFL